MAISGRPENPMAGFGAPSPSQQYPLFHSLVERPLEQQGLQVPPVFMGLHGDSLGENVALIDGAGNSWTVRLREVDGEWWLTEMGELGQHFSVQVGEAIIFRLLGNSQLFFTVFDREGVSRRA